MASAEQHDLAAVKELNDVLASRMRGVACAGALPTLNLDSGNEQVAIVAEALSRMHEQMAQAAAESQLRDRAELTAQLDRLHTTAAMQRKALHSYLDELRSLDRSLQVSAELIGTSHRAHSHFSPSS